MLLKCECQRSFDVTFFGDPLKWHFLIFFFIFPFWYSDVGCHIDGFIAVVAHTHVLQEGPVTGRTADVIAAANTAAEVALRLVRPGRKVSLFDWMNYSTIFCIVLSNNFSSICVKF